MFAKNYLIKKVMLVALLLGLGLVLLPISNASAAGLLDETPPTSTMEPDDSRLEEIYAKLSDWYEHQAAWMDKADANLVHVETLIDKANERGFDTAALQAALHAFTAVYPEAREYNLQAGEILKAHEGFNGSGKVIDRKQAIDTLKLLQQALKTAYDTMGGEEHAGRLLVEAVCDLVNIIRPIPFPAP